MRGGRGGRRTGKPSKGPLFWEELHGDDAAIWLEEAGERGLVEVVRQPADPGAGGAVVLADGLLERQGLGSPRESYLPS